MQKEKTINSTCSFTKRAKSAILDSLISVFASVLLMILSVFLYTKTPVYQEEYEQSSQSMNQITELVSESRLNEGILNEDGTYTIKTASELTKDFVNSLLYQKGLEVDAEKYGSGIVAPHNPALVSPVLVESGVSKVYIKEMM